MKNGKSNLKKTPKIASPNKATKKKKKKIATIKVDKAAQDNNSYIKKFTDQNEHAKISILENKEIIVETPWGVADCRLVVKGDDLKNLKLLNNIKIYTAFDAILHQDKNEIEFAYTYIDPDDTEDSDLLDRTFKIYFEEHEYTCGFRIPSDNFLFIADCFERLPFEGVPTMPQIRHFKQAKNIENLPDIYKTYFSTRVPRNFFIQGENLFKADMVSLCRNLNFMLHYYDRKTPQIVIKTDKTCDILGKESSRYSQGGGFPSSRSRVRDPSPAPLINQWVRVQ